MNATELATQLIAAKKAEADANAKRVALEQELIAILGSKEEGSETHNLENGLKITITAKLSYSADMPILLSLCDSIPESMRPIKREVKLDETGAKYLRNNEPDVWRMLSSAITVKPAKPSVTIKA